MEAKQVTPEIASQVLKELGVPIETLKTVQQKAANRLPHCPRCARGRLPLGGGAIGRFTDSRGVTYERSPEGVVRKVS